METHPYSDLQGLNEQLKLTTKQIQQEGYLLGGIWFKNTQSIICGTFPPTGEYKDRKGYIHYSSPRNKFWKHIDNIYQTNLYIPSAVAKDEDARIQNAKQKIDFLKGKKLGFVDVFTKVSRKVEGLARDTDLIPQETIFDNQIFDLISQQPSIKQIAFVYSLSRSVFESEIVQKTGFVPELIRPYNTNSIPLEVKRMQLHGRELYLSYSPIHGKIADETKRKALKKVFELDLFS